MKSIIITGSVGSGKTTLSKKLSRYLSFDYLDVNKIIKKEGYSEGYDNKDRCEIVDVKKLNKSLIKLIKESKIFTFVFCKSL